MIRKTREENNMKDKDQIRMDVLDHLYPGSETKEEYERVRKLFINRHSSSQTLKEWGLVEMLHLVPTMRILWDMSRKCDTAGINLYSGTDCRNSELMKMAKIPYVSPWKKETISYDKFYHTLFKHGPILVCDADLIFNVQRIFIDCFDERHIFIEGITQTDETGKRKRTVHPAHFMILPANKAENSFDTEFCSDYCLDIYKGNYPTADNLPCPIKDYNEISDQVWRCRLFANITE